MAAIYTRYASSSATVANAHAMATKRRTTRSARFDRKPLESVSLYLCQVEPASAIGRQQVRVDISDAVAAMPSG
jgi:hypothetical protein